MTKFRTLQRSPFDDAPEWFYAYTHDTREQAEEQVRWADCPMKIEEVDD